MKLNGSIKPGDRLNFQPENVCNVWAEIEITEIKREPYHKHDPMVAFKVVNAFDRNLTKQSGLYDDESRLREVCTRITHS